jgi:hypothetical protein
MFMVTLLLLFTFFHQARGKSEKEKQARETLMVKSIVEEGEGADREGSYGEAGGGSRQEGAFGNKILKVKKPNRSHKRKKESFLFQRENSQSVSGCLSENGGATYQG